MLRLIFIIGTGSFFGGVSRFLTTRLVQNYFTSAFPLGTFAVNLMGCFLIGIFYGISEKGNLMSAEWRMFLTVGFCGGFTTFSAFASENLALLKDSDFFWALMYTGASIFFGLMATWLGNLLIKLF